MSIDSAAIAHQPVLNIASTVACLRSVFSLALPISALPPETAPHLDRRTTSSGERARPPSWTPSDVAVTVDIRAVPRSGANLIRIAGAECLRLRRFSRFASYLKTRGGCVAAINRCRVRLWCSSSPTRLPLDSSPLTSSNRLRSWRLSGGREASVSQTVISSFHGLVCEDFAIFFFLFVLLIVIRRMR